MIKYLLLILIGGPYILFSTLVMTIMYIFKKHISLERRYKFLQSTVKLVVFLSLTKLNIQGLDIFRQEHSEGRLYASNHLAMFDILVYIALSNKPLIFISKKENAKLPFVNIHLRAIDCLLIDRKDLRQSASVCNKAVKYLKNGYDVFIFPEGTRSRDLKVHEFKAALNSIVCSSRTSTYLIAINNAEKALKINSLSFKRLKVDIKFFEPLSYEYYLENKKDFNELCRSSLQKQVDAFRMEK